MTAQSRAAVWFLPLLFLVTSALLSAHILRERSSAVQGAGPAGRSGGLLLEISRRPAFAFGFRNFLADLEWLNAVQVAGSRRMSRGDYDRLDLLIQAVNHFDPRFIVPYLLGGLVLGDSPNHTREALATLERGGLRHPRDWRFPLYIGYIRYFSLGNPVEGGKALQDAARLPGSPRHLPLLAARMLSEGREPETALAFLAEMETQETNPGRREALRNRIREVIVERDIQELERAAATYRERFGGYPETLSGLVQAGILRGIPAEPHGGMYHLAPGGKVRSDRVTHRLKVFRAP
jgi:hypothetical protein